MALHFILRNRNTSTEYSIPLTEGSLVDFLNYPSGSATRTENGRSWSCNKYTASGLINIELSSFGSDDTFGIAKFLSETLPAFDIPVAYADHDIDDYLEYGTPYDLIAPDQDDSETYPRYFISTTYTASSGNIDDVYTTTCQLQTQSMSPDSFEKWHGHGTAEVKNKYCMPLALKNTLGQYIYGTCNIEIKNGGGFGYQARMRITFTSAVTSENFVETDVDPGTKGFIPTAARTNPSYPGVGGRGKNNKKRPGYTGDSVSQPGAPDETRASAIGSGLLRAYVISESDLINVGKCLYSSTLLTAFANLFVNPLDAIISLMVFPFKPHTGSSEYVKLLNHVCTATDLGANASGSPLSKQFRTHDFGTVEIGEEWGNFLDYSQTSIELYLPFIGIVELDTSECMNGSINVQYTIDFFTGMCVANVLCTKTVVLPDGMNIPCTSQHSYQGNCAVQIPLTSVNYGSMVGSLIQSATMGLTNPASGAINGVSDAMTGGWAPRVSTKGTIGANAGFCSVLYPYVRITRPVTAEPESYQDVMGYPSYINTTLGECEDLCVCDDIDLHTITGATPNELARIKQYCQNGVHV